MNYLCFYDSLGPSVDTSNYWGDKIKGGPKRKKKARSYKSIFLTLVKLRQNLKEKDLFDFDIATSTVSKYFITFSFEGNRLDAKITVSKMDPTNGISGIL